MSGKRNAKLLQAVLATAPVLTGLMVSQRAHATTWIGAAGSWNSAANWAGTPNPPLGDNIVNPANSGSFLNSSSFPEANIGNNGTVTLGGINVGISRIRLGYAFNGATNPGTGALSIDSGSFVTDQDSVIGDG